jgi:integrase
MPFDAREAKLLQAGQHLILPEHPGLRLVATSTRRSWIYRYKSPADDRMRQVKLGEWPAMSAPAAIAKWEAARIARSGGQDMAAEKRAARHRVRAEKARAKEDDYLVKHLVQDYLSNHIDIHRKPAGRKEVRRLLEAHLGAIDDRPAALVLRSEAFKVIEGMAGTPVLAAQVRQEMGAAYDYGLDAGKLPANTPNWWRQIMRGKLRSKGKKIAGEHVGADKKALNERQVGELINWLPNFSRLVDDALTMYLWTGTRGSEIVAMEVSEIEEEETGLWWIIPKAKTKNARHPGATDLRVPLIGRAAAVVRRRMGATTRYLFPRGNDSAQHVDQKTVQTAVYYHQPYSKTHSVSKRPRLAVTHWSPHDLRRTVRTMLASMGCPRDVAESVLGHMLQGVEGVYNRHTYDAERLVWLTKLDAHLEAMARRHAGGPVILA